ncbi:MAG: hypothetical protein DRO40_01615 [Thermoprotei archaeon]|nr:MAG: hypothetical protein DRO40_01615 [Thermoprotei archaeon]
MRLIYDKIKAVLGKDFEKILYEEQNGFSAIILLKDREKGFLVCVKKTPITYYAKVMKLDNLMFWNCIYSLEDPRGLFVFAKEVEELVKFIVNKLKLLG